MSAGKVFCTARRGAVLEAQYHHAKWPWAEKKLQEQDIAQETHPVRDFTTVTKCFVLKVVAAFLKVGVPLTKLNHFSKVLQLYSYKQAGEALAITVWFVDNWKLCNI